MHICVKVKCLIPVNGRMIVGNVFNIYKIPDCNLNKNIFLLVGAIPFLDSTTCSSNNCQFQDDNRPENINSAD